MAKKLGFQILIFHFTHGAKALSSGVVGWAAEGRIFGVCRKCVIRLTFVAITFPYSIQSKIRQNTIEI